MKKEGAKSFILYHDLLDPFLLLSTQERGDWITAVFAYETGCPEIMPRQLSPRTEMLFSIVMKALDRNREAYVKKCTKNAENARRGWTSRAKQRLEKDTLCDRLPSDAKNAYNDSDSENENENENVSVNKSDSGSRNENENGNENESQATKDAGALSTPPSDALPPTAQAILSREERVRIFKTIPKEYIHSRLDRASLYAEEHDSTIGDVIVSWWLYDQRDAEQS